MPRSNWKQFACFLIFAVHQVQPQNNDTTTVSPTTEEPTTVPENTGRCLDRIVYEKIQVLVAEFNWPCHVRASLFFFPRARVGKQLP